MGVLALSISIKSDKAIKVHLEVNSPDCNSEGNPLIAKVSDNYSEITQNLIYKELAVMNLLTIKTTGNPTWIMISNITLKLTE